VWQDGRQIRCEYNKGVPKEGNEHSTRMGSERKQALKQDCVRKPAKEKNGIFRNSEEDETSWSYPRPRKPANPAAVPTSPFREKKINHVFVEKNLTLWPMELMISVELDR
jgi:hypothetical protein